MVHRLYRVLSVVLITTWEYFEVNKGDFSPSAHVHFFDTEAKISSILMFLLPALQLDFGWHL